MPFSGIILQLKHWFFFSIYLAVTSTVRSTLQEACVQILAPKRRIDILRDAMDARQNKRPYVITFCGVNGVGKSTNLAKVRNCLQLYRMEILQGRTQFLWTFHFGFYSNKNILLDCILADREWTARLNRSLWHIPRRRSRAAAYTHAQTQHSSPSWVTQWRHHGAAVREGLRKRRCGNCNGSHQLRYALAHFGDFFIKTFWDGNVCFCGPTVSCFSLKAEWQI